MVNKIFTQSQEKLSKESWRLLLKQKSELDKYRERQKELIRSIYKK